MNAVGAENGSHATLPFTFVLLLKCGRSSYKKTCDNCVYIKQMNLVDGRSIMSLAKYTAFSQWRVQSIIVTYLIYECLSPLHRTRKHSPHHFSQHLYQYVTLRAFSHDGHARHC